MMKMTEQGLALIKAFEGFRSRAYRDAVGVWTVGYGHTSLAGPPQVEPALTITREEAEKILARDVETFADGVRAVLRRELDDNAFSALVSFAYNVGLGNFRKSSVLVAVNSGAFDAVPRRLALWSKAGGRTLPGLVRRRAAEAALFAGEAKPVDAATPPEKPDVPAGKPPARSKTVWAAGLVAALASAQAALRAAAPWLAGALLLLALAALALIVVERLNKAKQEGV